MGAAVFVYHFDAHFTPPGWMPPTSNPAIGKSSEEEIQAENN